MSMEQAEDVAAKCTEFFDDGYGFACSESVLLGFQDVLGTTENIVPQIVTPFGGGLGGNGYTCGALLSSLIILGSKYGRTDANEDRTILYKKIDNIIQKFKEKYGTINCGEIRMIPSFIREDAVRLKKLKNVYHETICNELIENVAEWLQAEL